LIREQRAAEKIQLLELRTEESPQRRIIEAEAIEGEAIKAAAPVKNVSQSLGIRRKCLPLQTNYSHSQIGFKLLGGEKSEREIDIRIDGERRVREGLGRRRIGGLC
jgi:hypothetical protein